MNQCIALALAAAALSAAAPLATMMDATQPASIRNQACLDLRGASSPEAIAAFRSGLNDAAVRTCAATNLAKAGAVSALTDALESEQPPVRAAAARELGALARPDLLPILAKAARDPDLLAATNALEGLKNYPAGVADATLAALARSGGMVGTLALDRLVDLASPAAAPVARQLLAAGELSDQLAGVKALGELGDSTDIERLKPIAEKDRETVSGGARGFGLMPAFSMARAARTAIARIEQRQPPSLHRLQPLHAGRNQE